MMVILDTDFLIDLMRGDGGAVSYMKRMTEGYEPVAVSAITVMQLHHGIARARLREKEAERVERALKGATVHALTHDIAALAGRLDGDLAVRGSSIGPADVIIGATALHLNETVVTRNGRHFSRIKGLRIVAY
ncbi:MAG: type II toxin-antitoxin system VapC family toxin [Euryarchaeota archaeon]|nr:type II toxin-antitoxin system VapC family toxin [Euryarchaeota archaeon]